jgi:hypothetical protein
MDGHSVGLNPKPQFPPVPRKSMRWPHLKFSNTPTNMHRLLRKPWYSRNRYTATALNVTDIVDVIPQYSDFLNMKETPGDMQMEPNCAFDTDTCTCADVFALEKRMLRAETILQEVISAVLVCDELALLEREVSKSSTFNAALTREEVPKYFKNVLHNITKRHDVGIVPVQTD